MGRSPEAGRPRPRTARLVPATALALLTIFALGLSPRDAAAQWAVGPQAGLDLVEDEFSIGAHALIPFYNLGPIAQVAAYPNIDAFVFGDGTIVRFDLDLAFPFRLQTVPLVPYAGIGFGIVYVEEDFREDTRFDLNLLGGVGFQTGTIVEPYIEAVASLFGSDSVAILIGLNVFPMGLNRGKAAEQDNPAELPQDDDL